jgi:excisionase family DNA binding protein
MDATLRRKYAPHGDRTREGAVVKRAVRTAGSNDSSMGEVPDLAPVLAGDASAWTRFVAYYESRLRAVVRQAADHIEAFSNTDVDDVLRDFWFAAVADDMRMLRAFKPERGAALLTWLTFHVAHIASEHIRRKGEEATFVPLDEARHVAAPVQASVDEAIRAVVRDAITREMRQTVKPTSQSTLVTSAEYVSADRAAEIAGVRSATVRQWVSGGKLPGHRAGRLLRIRTDDLHRFLSGGRDTTTVVDIETRRRRGLERLR